MKDDRRSRKALGRKKAKALLWIQAQKGRAGTDILCSPQGKPQASRLNKAEEIPLGYLSQGFPPLAGKRDLTPFLKSPVNGYVFVQDSHSFQRRNRRHLDLRDNLSLGRYPGIQGWLARRGKAPLIKARSAAYQPKKGLPRFCAFLDGCALQRLSERYFAAGGPFSVQGGAGSYNRDDFP